MLGTEEAKEELVNRPQLALPICSGLGQAWRGPRAEMENQVCVLHTSLGEGS